MKGALHARPRIAIAAGADGGYELRATDGGVEFLEKQRPYYEATFGEVLVAHYGWGRAPAWAGFMGRLH